MTSTTLPAPATSGTMRRFQLGVIKATALLVGLGIGLAAQAAPEEKEARPTTGYEKPMPRDCGPDGQAKRDCFHRPSRDPQRQLETLHQQLALNADQEALWKSAKAGTDKLREEQRDEWRTRRDKLQKLLEGKNPDLRTIVAEMDKDQEARQQKHKAAREGWLKFYDALNPEQKQKASQFLLGQVGMAGHGMGPAGDMPPRPGPAR
ncbi:hypothetical protein DLREEDagrD3_20840 [Denitratisoma sp. agr-D3]